MLPFLLQIMDKDFIARRLKEKFGISHLNDMQNATVGMWHESKKNIVLYSPTGTGKTIAFAVPIVLDIDDPCVNTKVLIIEPTRELALQVTEVLKKLVPSIKTTPCYGGHNSQDEKQSLAATPTIVVGTPGRLLDHLKRGNLHPQAVTTLVLDEFDKSLELGFIDDVRLIIESLSLTVRTIMTSATEIKHVPDFIDTSQFYTVDFLHQEGLSPMARINTWQVNYPNNNRLLCLEKLLLSLPDEKTIIFTNQRDTAQIVHQQLTKKGVVAGLYIGTLEQTEREKVLSMFRNGSLLVLVSTDLAGRGIDISDIKHIIHYELPLTSEIFVHRNGRTARVDATGEVYVITSDEDKLAPFININGKYNFGLLETPKTKKPFCATIYISAGKKDKISRGDIVGYILHNCESLAKNDITGIDIYDHYTLVGVPKEKAEDIVKTISPFKLKKQKVKSRVVSFRPKYVK